MTMTTLTRLAGAGGLALLLTACMDVSMTVDVQSETEAEATMVTSMAADMVELMNAQAEGGDEEFCAEGELIENADMIDCVVVQSGPFDELDFEAEDGQGPMIEAIGGGQVRVTFPTGDLAESLDESMGEEQDPQMQAMITSMFEGHAITITVTGGTVVDTNMNISADGMTANYEIPFVDLFAATLDMPGELYAVVQK
ncbi:hypothetical protein [Pelagibacterium halotolerans]|nr:hypothetical protein [Pelagibacterium halotolerans]QJR20403.1 hypothetical protein HKM20_19315 [Pelagibacterium halotolerans]